MALYFLIHLLWCTHHNFYSLTHETKQLFVRLLRFCDEISFINWRLNLICFCRQEGTIIIFEWNQ